MILLEHVDVLPKLWNFPHQQQHLQPEEEAGVPGNVVLPSLQLQILLSGRSFVEDREGGGQGYEMSVGLQLREIFLLENEEAEHLSDDVDQEAQDENDPGSEGGVLLVVALALDLVGQVKPVAVALISRSTEIPEEGSAVD